MYINDIYDRLEEILVNKDNVAPESIGGYIVGCTIIPDGIETLYVAYPVLEEISEIGSDLETENYGPGTDGNNLLILFASKMIELKAAIYKNSKDAKPV